MEPSPVSAVKIEQIPGGQQAFEKRYNTSQLTSALVLLMEQLLQI